MNARQKNWVSIIAASVLAGFLVLGLGVDLFGWMYSDSQPEKSVATTSATVVRVVDGDTLDVNVGTTTEAVRLIGIDAPEIRWPADDNNLSEPEEECFGFAARNFLARKIGTSSVTLAGDPTQPTVDEYDRQLAYVYTGDKFLNKTLIAEGYARELTVGEGYEYQKDFQTAENQARQDEVGLWSVCE